MIKLNKNHKWKHVFVGLFIFLLGFFTCKLLVYKKATAGKHGAYLHLKLGDKEVKSSQLMDKKMDYEQRLKAVEEKVGALEEQLAE
jgi:hypothetical protein